MPSGITTVLSVPQYFRSIGPKVIKSFMSSVPLQPLNASFPKHFMLPGSTKFVKFAQSLKASSPIIVTLSGIETLST